MKDIEWDMDWKLVGLFWTCQRGEDNHIDIISKKVMGEVIVVGADMIDVGSVIDDDNIAKFILSAREYTNAMLPSYLRMEGIRQWIPLRGLTHEYDVQRRQFEICYYHDIDVYNNMYQCIDEGYIMAPNCIVISEFNSRYGLYGLNYGDELTYASTGADSDAEADTTVHKRIKKDLE
jgi:hypothetical protein